MAPAIAAPGRAGDLVDTAQARLRRGDALGAEIALKQALAHGARREAVAAYMGEALLDQDRPRDARAWLGPQRFSSASAAVGYRALARLERVEGNLPAAGAAFDKAIALTPDDAGMWVEIGRLRYAGAEHLLAIEAADRALLLDPANVRALEFRGQIVRDQYGPAAALPWFEAALKQAPRDLSVMGEQAATLGDLGRAQEMLAVTRRMLAIDPKNARAFYLQAVLAARAGNVSLARAMLNRTGERLKDLPGAMLLDGVLALKAGNPMLAVEAFERLSRRQPANARVRDLLARAMFLAGLHGEVVKRFAPAVAQADASAYLLGVVARAHAARGRNDLAAPLLERARRVPAFAVVPVSEGSALGALVAGGRLAEAEAEAEAARRDNPGSATAQIGAGDVQLAMGRGEAALERYRAASRVRMPESLMRRIVATELRAGRNDEAAALVDAWLAQNPWSVEAALLAARFAHERGDRAREGVLREFLARAG